MWQGKHHQLNTQIKLLLKSTIEASDVKSFTIIAIWKILYMPTVTAGGSVKCSTLGALATGISILNQSLWENFSASDYNIYNNGKSGISESDEKIIQRFEEYLHFENGSYVTGLLRKHDPLDLKDKFNLAKRQFNRLPRELRNDSFIRQKFEEINFQKESNVIQGSIENDRRTLLTRGVSVISLKSGDLWWSGPPWLKSSQSYWPQLKFKVPYELQQKRRVVVNTAIVHNNPDIDSSRFSSLAMLLGVTAYVFRFLRSDELGEQRALMPSHFLLPSHRDSGFLPEQFLDLFVSASNRVTLSWRKIFQTKILKQFWVKWKTEYLQQLQSAHSLLDPSSIATSRGALWGGCCEMIWIDGATTLLVTRGRCGGRYMSQWSFRVSVHIYSAVVKIEKVDISFDLLHFNREHSFEPWRSHTRNSSVGGKRFHFRAQHDVTQSALFV
ncbi:integrase catalytic domain-containing protein [Nephila pilipes]|uniref:Integrase catalytic domain-containing protein n=1 Tax=Nephila pilipes TaxID=299642 RepID=A0A8X6QAU7_NEPPI|nr:integrase catalytic domain-containing protein [Nephila pilipes]